jgi:signal transduction histidine kinase
VAAVVTAPPTVAVARVSHAGSCALGGCEEGRLLRKMPIRTQLMAMLLLPLLAVMVLSIARVGTAVAEGRNAGQARALAGFAVQTNLLVTGLQQERGQSSDYLGSDRRRAQGALVARRASVDRFMAAFREASGQLPLSGANPRLRQRLSAALAGLDGLDEQRRAIDQRPIAVAEALRFYTVVIDRLLDLNDQIAVGSNNERLLGQVLAFVALSRAKEAAAQEGSFMTEVFWARRFGEGQFAQFAGLIATQQAWFAQFQSNATPEQWASLASTIANPKVAFTEGVRRDTLAGGSAARLQVDPVAWWGAMTVKVDLLGRAEQGIAADLRATSQSIRASADRQAQLYAAVLAIVVGLTVALSLLIGRRMARQLRALRDAALEVADDRLPTVVEQLQTATRVEDLDTETPPLPVASRDEIGEVAGAFDKVHRVAVRVAVEQAALRRSVADMFVNFGRRNQGLVDRQLELIEDLERDRADPDELADLFRLDHLATRMRRNAENLIVLAGADPARQWNEPVPLATIVRAAVAEVEVEDYSRVRLALAEDLLVAGHAASDLAHLLAELIENAIAFSPPQTRVQVSGEPAHSGHVIVVEDAGLGMSEEELAQANQRLADPSPFDFALSQRLGHYVVGRLARRRGIRVELRRSWFDGVTALVLVPQALLVQQADGSLPGRRAAGAWSPPRLAGRGRRPGGQVAGDQPTAVRAATPSQVAGGGDGLGVGSSGRRAAPPAGVRRLLARFQTRTDQGDDPRATPTGQDDAAPNGLPRGEHGAAL